MARTQLGLGHLTASLPFERKTVGLLQAAPHYGEAKNSLVTPMIAINAPHTQGILACDFFTVETLTPKTLYVLFFIELSTRKVHVVGATARPDSAWVTQQARNLAIEGHLEHARFLLHDRDAKFSGPFDEVFGTEEVRVIRTPIRAPRANAFAERFVRTVRSECLDHILIYRRRHLERVLRAYVDHYMEERPHRGLDLATPRGVSAPEARDPERKRIERRDVLGGLIHEYRWAA